VAFRFSIGCGCCGSCNITICVSVCGAPVVGATVQVKTGSTVLETETTDGSGCAVFTTITTGTYTVVVTWADGTQTFPSQFLLCGATDSITLSGAGSTFECCGPCPISLSNLQLTDVNGTITLTASFPGGSFAGWYGCYTIPISGVEMVSSGHGLCTFASGTINLPICYFVQCASSSTLTVTRSWTGVCTGTLSGSCSCPGGSLEYIVSTSGCTPCPDLSTSSYPCSAINNPFVDSVSNTSAWSGCPALTWSGTLTGSTCLSDPVGGTVALSG
jgi:hypothetical protein